MIKNLTFNLLMLTIILASIAVTTWALSNNVFRNSPVCKEDSLVMICERYSKEREKAMTSVFNELERSINLGSKMLGTIELLKQENKYLYQEIERLKEENRMSWKRVESDSTIDRKLLERMGLKWGCPYNCKERTTQPK